MRFKIFSFMLLGLLTLFSVNAEIYLNECGNSDWVDGETYIINFTSVDSTFTSNTCFPVLTNNQDIIIKGYNQTIDINKELYYFFDFRNVFTNNIEIRDFNLNYVVPHAEALGNLFLRTYSTINSGHIYFNNSLFSNIKFTGYSQNLFYIYGKGSTSMSQLSFNNNILNNISGDFSTSFLIFELPNSNLVGNYFDNNVFNNVIIKSPRTIADSYSVDSWTAILFGIHNSFLNNSFHNSFLDFYGIQEFKDMVVDRIVDSTDLIIKNTGFPDIDNNNICEVTGILATNNNQLSIRVDVLNNSFVQDIEYGKYQINTNEHIIFVNENNLTTNGFIAGTNDNNKYSFLSNTYLDNRLSIDLGTSNEIDCSKVSNIQCFFLDSNYAGVTTGDYRPLIGINSNNKIDFAVLEKSNNGNNAHLIANTIDYVRDNFILTNSVINKNDNRNKNGDNQLIKLNMNNLKINNNTFNTGGSTISEYEIFDIIGLKETNNIYYNVFDSSNSGLGVHELFINNCEANFYNNKIDASYTLPTTCANLEINPLVGYLNTDDNKIYYYYVGNYYNDYSSTCEDLDSDGFCDTPFSQGLYTDSYTLSEYPFNWKAHLFNAVSISDNLDFNISIFVPEAQNLIYDLTDNTQQLEFSFQHDSNFIDLTCSYIINGQSLYSIANVDNNVQNVFLSGFDEGYYSFYVECYNDYKYVASDLYSFFVNYPDGIVPDSNYTNAYNDTNIIDYNNETITPNVQLTGDDIINFNSVSDTNENTTSFLSDIIAFIVSIGVPFAIITSIIILFLAFVRLIF